MPSKKKAKENETPQATPNQRYYIAKSSEGDPLTYEQAAGVNNKKKRISIPIKRDLVSSKYPRAPNFSPISRLKFGQKLEKMIAQELQTKIANAAAGTVVSVGNISSLSTVAALTEQELLKKFGTNNITSNFERPYDDIDYTTFHDSVRSDGMTRLVAVKKTNYTVGEFTDIEFVPNFFIEEDQPTATETATKQADAQLQAQEKLSTDSGLSKPEPPKPDVPPPVDNPAPEQQNQPNGKPQQSRKEIQDQLNHNPLLNSFRQELKKIDEDCDFYLALHGIILHYTTFGQGLIAIESDEHGVPIALKILSGMRIGRLFKDKKTWKIRGIEYLDYSSTNQANILLTEDLIYIPNLDFNIAPNTSGYGLSDLETIRHIAEQNVILNQMDIKEGNAKYHTPKVFVSVANAETPEDITDLSAALEVSQSVVTDLDGEPKVIDNTTNILELAEERDMNDAAICRYGDVPSILAGFENAQIRAAASQVLYAWTQSSLLKIRETLRVYLQKQWYLRNLAAIIKRRLRRLGLLETVSDGKTGKQTEQITRDALNQQQQKQDASGQPLLNPEQQLSENGLPIDKNGAEIIPDVSEFNEIRDFIPFLDHLEKLPFTIKMTYETIRIDGMLETSASVIGLKNARIINNMYAWKLLKFKDLEANPPPDLEDTSLVGTELFTAFGKQQSNLPNQQGQKGGLGDIANMNIEKLATNRGRKPRPRLETSQ